MAEEKDRPFENNHGIPSMGAVLLVFPIGFAVWYIPLTLAESIGLLPALLIIVGILTIIVIVGLLGASAQPEPDDSPKTKQKTYTV